MRSPRRILTLAFLLLLVGCTPPYPTAKRTKGPTGLVGKLPDRSAVEAGKTRREEVLSAFKEVDTGVSSPWLFWARWDTSRLAMNAVTDSGIEQIPLWSGTNFLVEFDDAGTVKKSVTLSDTRIIPELKRILAEHPEAPAQTTSPISISALFRRSAVRSCAGTIKLSLGGVAFSKPPYSDCPSDFNVPVQELTVDSFTPFGDFDPSPVRSIWVTLHFSNKTPFGSKVPALLKVGDLFSMLRFIGASRAAR